MFLASIRRKYSGRSKLDGVLLGARLILLANALYCHLHLSVHGNAFYSFEWSTTLLSTIKLVISIERGVWLDLGDLEHQPCPLCRSYHHAFGLYGSQRTLI